MFKRKKAKSAVLIRRERLFRRDEFVCSACGAVSERPFCECPGCRRTMRAVKSDPVWVDEIELLDIALE